MRSVVRVLRRRKPREVSRSVVSQVVPEEDALSTRLWAIQALVPIGSAPEAASLTTRTWTTLALLKTTAEFLF